MAWGNFGTESRIRLDPADFTINRNVNLVANYKLDEDHDPEQVPFSRGIKGPSTLRGRTTPYKVTTS